MDIELILTSFPKLLSATLVTLKLLSASLFFWIINWFIICNFKIKQKQIS